MPNLKSLDTRHDLERSKGSSPLMVDDSGGSLRFQKSNSRLLYSGSRGTPSTRSFKLIILLELS